MLSEKLQPFLSLEHGCKPENHVLTIPCPDGAVAVGIFTNEFKPPTVVYLLEQAYQENSGFYWKFPVHKFFAAHNFQEWILVYAFCDRFEFFRLTARYESGSIAVGRGNFSHEPRMIAALITGVMDELHKARKQTREILVQKKNDALSNTKEAIEKLRKKLMKAYCFIAASIFCIILLIIGLVLIIR